MFGSGFYNPYLYQPYYQAANVASNLGSATGTGILGKKCLKKTKIMLY